MMKRISVTIDGVKYHAVLQNNELAENIAAMCPFALDCTRSGDHEYYAALPRKAAVNGRPATTIGHRNGIYYFEGWNAFSFVFKDCDTAPYKIHHIGDFEEDVSAVLEKGDRNMCIFCEAE